MGDDGRTSNYFTNAVHKDCGGLVRVMIEVTEYKRSVGFMCAKCHAMWSAPDGNILSVPPNWVERKPKKRARKKTVGGTGMSENEYWHWQNDSYPN